MDAESEHRERDDEGELPEIREVGPADHGWKMLMHASERQANALRHAMDEGRVFATDDELDNFMKEHE